MNKNQNILFIFKKRTTFIQADIEILNTEHKVREWQFYPFNNFFQIGWKLINQFFFLIFNIWKFDIIYIWFADYHGYLPTIFAKLLRKKTYVIIGGFDVNMVQEINYGALKQSWRGKMIKRVIKSANYCLPVTEELVANIKQIYSSAQIKIIHTGYDEKKWFLNINQHKQILAITVSITSDKKRFLVKGLDRFVELARKLPSYKFCVVGTTYNYLLTLTDIPDNLIILPPISQKELNKYYGNSMFYAQFSRSEGLPNAICEAMLCGCIPIGMNVGGIKNLIKNYGLTLENWDVDEVIHFIKNTKITKEWQNNNRNYITQNYSIDKRRRTLLSLLT